MVGCDEALVDGLFGEEMNWYLCHILVYSSKEMKHGPLLTKQLQLSGKSSIPFQCQHLNSALSPRTL